MPPEPPAPEVLDLRVVESMFPLPGAEGAALLPAIVGLFMREEPDRIARLPGLAAERNGGDLGHAAHQLAGACAVIGARQLQAAALAVEDEAAAGRWAEMPARLAAVEQAWNRLLAALAERGLWPGRR